MGGRVGPAWKFSSKQRTPRAAPLLATPCLLQGWCCIIGFVMSVNACLLVHPARESPPVIPLSVPLGAPYASTFGNGVSERCPAPSLHAVACTPAPLRRSP